MIRNFNSLDEAFNLPPELDSLTEGLAYFIASLFLKYFQTRASHGKTKKRSAIVTAHDDLRAAIQYRNEGKALFGIIGDNRQTAWGKADGLISLKSPKDFPKTVLKITDGYSFATSGYVEEVEPNEIYILVDRQEFINQFKGSTAELIDTIKHEVRHWKQLNQGRGLPKTKVLNRNSNILGYRHDPKYKATKEPHYMRDIEFKTNLHTYAFYIEKYLNKTQSRSNWKTTFKALVTGASSPEDLDPIPNNLGQMKIRDPLRWKFFIKELYKLIFHELREAGSPPMNLDNFVKEYEGSDVQEGIKTIKLKELLLKGLE